MNRFIGKIKYFLPLLAFVALSSLLVDPAEIYHSGRFEKQAAAIQLQGKSLKLIQNYDERLFQLNFISGLAKSYSCVIIGSSRSLQINSDFFKGQSTYNSSVSGATLEDYLAIYELYRRSGMLPSKLVIGLDPWVLNKNNGQIRWQSINEPYYSLKRQMGYGTPSLKSERLTKINMGVEKYGEILSPTYFQAALKVLLGRFKGKAENLTKITAGEGFKRFDGCLNESSSITGRTIAEINQEAAKYIDKTPAYSLGDYKELDPEYMKLLTEFISLVKKQNIEIVFFFPPYHPKVFNFLAAKYSMVNEAEKYFRGLAHHEGIDVIGSYNPYNLNLHESDFFDGMHPNADAVRRMFMQAEPLVRTP